MSFLQRNGFSGNLLYPGYYKDCFWLDLRFHFVGKNLPKIVPFLGSVLIISAACTSVELDPATQINTL